MKEHVDLDSVSGKDLLRNEVNDAVQRCLPEGCFWQCVLVVARRRQTGSVFTRTVCGELDSETPVWAWRGILGVLSSTVRSLINDYAVPDKLEFEQPVMPKNR